MIVIDAAVLANAVGDDGEAGSRARQILRLGDDVIVPDVADVEAVAVLRRRWQAGTLGDDRFEATIGDLRDLPLFRHPCLRLMSRAFELRAAMTPFDATYVALAEALDCILVTADARLAQVPGPRCKFQVLE